MGIELNPNQREAVTWLDSPLLVVAGAGSGKTRVLTAKIAWLITETDIEPWQILAVTFTNKAAGEMVGRVRDLAGEAGEAVTAGTFHSFCARLLRRHGDTLGYSPGYSIYDESDSRTLLKRLISELGLPERSFSVGMVRARIGQAKNEMAGAGAQRWTTGNWIDEGVGRVYAAYEQALRDRNAMDFDDLLLNAVRLFEEEPAIARRYAERYRYVLVDEYQDTNRPQYLLIKSLAAVHRGVCVVGDPDQSIYSWRGADIRNIRDFERDYPDARVVVLDQNYRSTTTILGVASGLIKQNSGQHRRRLWSELGTGEPVRELVFINDEEEARGVTRIIAAKVRQERRNLYEIVILYRTNGQSRQFEHALREAGLGYTIVGGVRFYERAEIKDTLAWLRLLVNPRDTVSLARALAAPRRGIGEVSLGRILRHLAEWAGDPLDGLAAAAAVIGRGGPGLTAFVDILKRFTARLEDTAPAELARGLLEESGYLDMLAAEGTIEAEARRENLGELLSALDEYGERAGAEASLADFLAEVSLLTDIDEWEEAEPAVTLMTLHAAKGLEFPIVFMTGLEEELCPILREDTDAEALEEERRLCYVGMTRAREELYLARARRRRRWGSVLDRLPSRFLGELPSELVQTIDQLRLDPVARAGSRQRGERRTDAAMAEIPDYENENQDAPTELVPGQEVEHSILGRGRILEVSGTGEQLRLIVAFHDAGTRRLMARYARLKVL